jgi:hypothetical protein
MGNLIRRSFLYDVTRNLVSETSTLNDDLNSAYVKLTASVILDSIVLDCRLGVMGEKIYELRFI